MLASVFLKLDFEVTENAILLGLSSIGALIVVSRSIIAKGEEKGFLM